MDAQRRNKTLRFLMDLPTFCDLTIGEQKFHLVHAFPGKTVEDRIWERPGMVVCRRSIMTWTGWKGLKATAMRPASMAKSIQSFRRKL